MVEDYNALNLRAAALQREALNFGTKFKAIGSALINEKQSLADRETSARARDSKANLAQTMSPRINRDSKVAAGLIQPLW
jgi:hypothetical protein